MRRYVHSIRVFLIPLLHYTIKDSSPYIHWLWCQAMSWTCKFSTRKKKLAAATRKKNEQLRLNNMQVDKIVSLSSYSQIFSLIFVFIIHHLAIQIKVQLWLPHVKNVSYFFFSHLKIRNLSKMHLISFFFISKSEIDGSLDNLWQKLHFWPSSWYWHSLLSSPAKSPKCILAGCIVKKTSSVFNNKWTSWGRAVIFVV